MSGAPIHFSWNADGRTLVEPVGGRPRTVTFRVSHAEFESLMRGCQSSGARSLSAFARDAAIDKASATKASSTTLTGDLTTLTKALAQVDSALQDASQKIRRVLGPADGLAARSGDPVE
jgi:hypothetical protein